MRKKHETLKLFSENDSYPYGKAYWALERDRPEGMKGSFKVSDYVDSMSNPTLITTSWGTLVLSDEPSNIWDEATREYHKGPHYNQVIMPVIPGWACWQPLFVGRIIPLVAAIIDHGVALRGRRGAELDIQRELLDVTDKVCQFFVQCKQFGHCDSGGTKMAATYVSESAWQYLSRFPGLFGDSGQTNPARLEAVQRCRNTVAGGGAIAWAI